MMEKVLVVGGGLSPVLLDDNQRSAVGITDAGTLRRAERGREKVYEAQGYKLLTHMGARPGEPYKWQYRKGETDVPRPVAMEIEYLRSFGHEITAGVFGGWWVRERQYGKLYGQRRFKTDEDLCSEARTKRYFEKATADGREREAKPGSLTDRHRSS